MRVEDDVGREFDITSKRFVNMHTQHPHLCGIQYPYILLLSKIISMTTTTYSIAPINYSGEIQIKSSLDGSVENTGTK